MAVNNRRGIVRNANHAVGRLRTRVSAAVYRGQLGPATEADVDLVASRTWHNHRAI